MRTTLVLDALRMALHRRGGGADVELVHHSDRGSPNKALRAIGDTDLVRLARPGQNRLEQEAATESKSHSLVAAARAAGVRDTRVLAALGDVPRAAYVPAASVCEIEADRPIPIGGAQVTTQPSLVAAMVEALALEGGERVLEVGAGLGYQAAILARLAREVWTVERRPELAEAAERHLAAQGVENVHVELADGSAGLAAHAPYDAIVVAAAHPQVPAPLVAQLAPGGRLVQPIGPGGAEAVTLFQREPGGLVRLALVTYARFVPLVGRYGFADRG